MHRFLTLTLLAAAAASSVLARMQYSNVGMVCLVNKERKKHGLKPLGVDAKLTKAAQSHSDYQARTRKMSHTGQGGSKPSQRISRAGYNWKSTGENVAYGYKSMEEVMKVWMKSPGHRKNILGKSYTAMGSAVAFSGNTPYFTQEFASDGRPATNVPKCDGSDYGDDDSYGGNDSYGDNMDYGNDSYGDQDNSYGGGRGGRGGRKDSYGGDDNMDYSDNSGSGRRGGRKDSYGGDDNMDYGSGRRGGRGGRDNNSYGGDNDNMDYGSGRGGRGGDKDCDDDKGGRRGGRRNGGGGGRRGGNQEY